MGLVLPGWKFIDKSKKAPNSFKEFMDVKNDKKNLGKNSLKGSDTSPPPSPSLYFPTPDKNSWEYDFTTTIFTKKSSNQEPSSSPGTNRISNIIQTFDYINYSDYVNGVYFSSLQCTNDDFLRIEYVPGFIGDDLVICAIAKIVSPDTKSNDLPFDISNIKINITFMNTQGNILNRFKAFVNTRFK